MSTPSSSGCQPSPTSNLVTSRCVLEDAVETNGGRRAQLLRLAGAVVSTGANSSLTEVVGSSSQVPG